MARWAYVNGRFQQLCDPAICVEDRAFQFSEGVYEVVAITGGRLIDADPHLDRFARSAAALKLGAPPATASLRAVMAEAARRNRVRDGWIYLQWTGGAAPRDFAPRARGPGGL
ncbi:MAG: aminotransferase class IV, partial [Pseudomonadota bacterium]